MRVRFRRISRAFVTPSRKTSPRITPPCAGRKSCYNHRYRIRRRERTADFSWRISKRFSIELGYRYLYLDYEKNGFVMDTYNDGIFIGLNWSL